MPYNSIIQTPGTIPNPAATGTHYRSIIPNLPDPAVVASQAAEKAHLQQQLKQEQTLKPLDDAVKKNTTGGFSPKNLGLATRDVGVGVARFVPRSFAGLESTAEQAMGKTPKETPNRLGRYILGTEKVQSSQERGAGAAASHPGGFKIPGINKTLSPAATGGAEAGLSFLQDVLGAKGGVKSLAKTGEKTASLIKGKDASLPSPAEPKTPPKSTATPVETPAKVGQGSAESSVQKPNIQEAPVTALPKPKMAPLGEEGSIAPGQAASDVKQMLQKHQASTQFSGDLEKNATQVEGAKKVIAQDTTKLIKQRSPLSSADKQTLQDYRDAKAAGIEAKPLPAHLVAEDQAVTELNKTAQAHDAELARLNGQEAKAQAIEARDPSTYTHRVAQGKGNSLDYVLQGDRKNPLNVSGLSKSKPSGKARTFMAATDETGSRRVVAIKNTVLKNEIGQKVAQGKLVQAIDNGKSENLGKLKFKTNQDFLDKELSPFQNKIKNLQKEGDALSNVKAKGGVSEARIKSLAQKAALLEDARNFSTLTKAEAKSLRDATLKLRELTNVKEPGTTAGGRLKTINHHLIQLNNKVAEIHAKYDPENLDKKIFAGKDGKKYTIGQATTSEITKATGQKYYTDPKLLALKNYAEGRTALENARFIESIKQHPDFSKFASAPSETAPKGWQEVNGLFQFMGYKFEPKTAEVLRDIVKNSADEKGALDAAGKFLRQTIVYFPLKHSLNELATSVIDRGLSSLVNPMAYKRGISSLVEAYHEVTNMGQKFQDAQKAGLHTVTGGDKALQDVFKKELINLKEESPTIQDVAKQWGSTPKRVYNAVQNLTVWQLQDILNMQRVIERTKPTLFGKGSSLEDAVAKTQKYNLQYSVPSRVGPKILPGAARRSLARTLSSPKVFFGRYKYDIYRIATNIIKDTVNPKSLIKDPKQNAQALDKLAALSLGAAVLWPLVDKGIQKATGNKNAYMKAPGVLELPSAVKDVAQGKKKAGPEVSNQLYISSVITQGLDLKNNRDAFTGKQIYDPNTSFKQQFSDTGKWIAAQQAPSQQLSQIKNNKEKLAVNTLLSLASARLPKNPPEVNNLNSLKFDTLPNVQSKAKQLVQKGDYQGAVDSIKSYNDQTLETARSALKAAGQAVPDDKTLKSDLEKAGYYYNPQVKTVQSWSRTVNTTTLDSILNPKQTAKGRSRKSSRTGSSSQKLFQ